MLSDFRIAVIGANGQLGTDLVSYLKRGEDIKIIPVYHSPSNLEGTYLDVSNQEQVKEFFKDCHPNIVINTAAFHKVDLCEEHPERAFEVNAFGAKNLAKSSRMYGSTLVHISTDYVFDGNLGRPYSEEDIPNPVNAYGKSKLEGENLIKDTLGGENYFIIRTQALYGLSKSSVKGTNFVETILKSGKEKKLVKVVNDQITNPTFTKDLAEGITSLIETERYGTYHLTNQGSCSWLDFAREIFRLENIDAETVPVTTEEAAILFDCKARRPLNTSLNTKKASKLGINLRPWSKGLEEYLKYRKKNGI